MVYCFLYPVDIVPIVLPPERLHSRLITGVDAPFTRGTDTIVAVAFSLPYNIQEKTIHLEGGKHILNLGHQNILVRRILAELMIAGMQEIRCRIEGFISIAHQPLRVFQRLTFIITCRYVDNNVYAFFPGIGNHIS